jgi:hypothetical protein
MTQKRALMVLAGAAIGFSSVASAQSDQTRAYGDELIADGSARTSALAPQAGANVDVGGLIQVRYVANFRDDVANDEDTAIGFQLPNTRLWAEGNVADDWSFRVDGGFDVEGNFSLLDAYAVMTTEGGWDIGLGQFRLPFLREELVRSWHQLAVDRSAMSTVFGAGRSQGVWTQYSAEEMRFTAAFSDGARAANTDFTSMQEADWAVTGRFEYMFWGAGWDRFDDFTGWHGDDNAGMFGVAGHYQSGGDSFNTADVSIFGLTGDVSVKGNAWNAYGAVVWLNVDPDGADSSDDFGFLVQGGWMPTEQFELFGRWDSVMADNESDFNTLTVGVNYFFTERSHAAKFTADIQWFFDTQADSLVEANTRTGLLADPNDNQVALRLQMQLLF